MKAIYAVIEGDGELYGTSEDPAAASPWFWADAMAEDSGCEIVELAGVPGEVLEASRNGSRRRAGVLLRPYIRRVIYRFG